MAAVRTVSSISGFSAAMLKPLYRCVWKISNSLVLKLADHLFTLYMLVNFTSIEALAAATHYEEIRLV
jgi:hypothetical protein